jgi:GntR family transcriptional regulator
MAPKKEHRKSSRYRDIAAELQKQIRLGAYAVGKLLPTETELMARFAASHRTVRETLAL